MIRNVVVLCADVIICDIRVMLKLSVIVLCADVVIQLHAYVINYQLLIIVCDTRDFDKN